MIAIVTGMIASYPVGGVLWDYGQYAVGLERLGFEVYYLEDTAWQTYDPRTRTYGNDPTFGVRFLAQSLAAVSPSLASRWHFRAMDGTTYGMDAQKFSSVLASADLFLNVSGSAILREEYARCANTVLIDTDPGWNHFRNYPRQDENPGWGGGLGYRSHRHFYTYAENIGAPDCLIPDLGLQWRRTRPPVVPDLWKPEPPGTSWTTVMTWQNFSEAIEYQGQTYGTKEAEFHHIEALPKVIARPLEVAAGGATAHHMRLRKMGWSVVDSHGVSETAGAYRSYVQGSRGELSVAKNVYAATRSGWFSCRSTCYLAASRPVVVQDTGFSRYVPVGLGLMAFTNHEEAHEAIVSVEADYVRHQRAAREIANEYFHADRVLGDMLGDLGAA